MPKRIPLPRCRGCGQPVPRREAEGGRGYHQACEPKAWALVAFGHHGHRSALVVDHNELFASAITDGHYAADVFTDGSLEHRLPGLHVWEGRVSWYQCDYETGETDLALEGDWRPATTQEIWRYSRGLRGPGMRTERTSLVAVLQEGDLEPEDIGF